MSLPRFCHHGSPILQRFPTVFTRNFRTSPRLWLPRSSVNVATTSTPETPRFRDELVRSTSPKSFSDHVRYPGIRNQILVGGIRGSCSELVVLNEPCIAFHLRLFRCIFGGRQAHQLRHELLGPETFARVKHLDHGPTWFRPDEEGEVFRICQGASHVGHDDGFHLPHPPRPVDDAGRARSGTNSSRVPPNNAQILCNLGVHLRCPTTCRR